MSDTQLTIFISYSDADIAIASLLRHHISRLANVPVTQSGLISLQSIKGSPRWFARLNRVLDDTRVAIIIRSENNTVFDLNWFNWQIDTYSAYNMSRTHLARTLIASLINTQGTIQRRYTLYSLRTLNGITNLLRISATNPGISEPDRSKVQTAAQHIHQFVKQYRPYQSYRKQSNPTL